MKGIDAAMLVAYGPGLIRQEKEKATTRGCGYSRRKAMEHSVGEGGGTPRPCSGVRFGCQWSALLVLPSLVSLGLSARRAKILSREGPEAGTGRLVKDPAFELTLPVPNPLPSLRASHDCCAVTAGDRKRRRFLKSLS